MYQLQSIETQKTNIGYE